MIKEWADDQIFNSFNSLKGLMYIEHYKAILKGEFLPPIEVNIDPVNKCNLNCIFCNNVIARKRNILMTKEHLLDLVKFCGEWGVKGICFAGGGESLLHPNLIDALALCTELGMQSAILTNGLFINDEQLAACAKHCEWIGVSVDAATPQTYQALKGVNRFEEVLENLSKLRHFGAKEITYKFLIHPLNQYEIYRATQTARFHRCHRIHIRPVALKYSRDEFKYDMDRIHKDLRDSRQFEDEDFKVFTVMHKYDPELHTKFPFEKCRATPLFTIFEANGDISICLDHKGDRSKVIGRHDDVSKIKEIWGSEHHKKVIDAININMCKKCTFNPYQQQIEQVVLKDKMHYAFP